MAKKFSLILLLSALSLLSCDRIKTKGQNLTNTAKEKVINKSNDIADKISPAFDAYHADTKYNKQRFSEFLKVEITPDIKNIFCFDDAMGIDADYQFSFNCEAASAERIIAIHKLILDNETTDYAFGLQNDFDWWDKEKIKTLQLYSWRGEHQYFKYFWYDKVEQRAYFFDFDM
jgi:hypothetical protein